MQTCPQCGRENAPNAKFCVHCGATLAGAAAPQGQQFAQQAPQAQPGQAQPAYQPMYRAPRQPFTGDLREHLPFVVIFVLALGISFVQFFGGELGAGSGTGSWSSLFENVIVHMLFALIFMIGGILGLAGCFGLWRFKEWGRMLVMIGAATYTLAGLLTLIAGGMNKLGGVNVAAQVLWGIIMMAIGGIVIFYMFTDDVRSRMTR